MEAVEEQEENNNSETCCDRHELPYQEQLSVDGCGLTDLIKRKKHEKNRTHDEQPLVDNTNDENVCSLGEQDGKQMLTTPKDQLAVATIPASNTSNYYFSHPEQVYDMSHKKRGKMVIISNRYFLKCSGLDEHPRNGTEFDAENIRTTFSGLGFECEIHEDKTCSQMLQIIIRASESTDDDCDCMAFALLTHGDQNELVYGTDGVISLHNLLSPLKFNYNMNRYVGKPKLIFIQACRGNKLDPGVDVTDGPKQGSSVGIKRIPVEADFLYSYSTSPGYFSFRGQRGSIYVRVLCSMLRKYQHSLDLQTILTRVNYEIAHYFESNVSKQHPDHVILSHKKQLPSVVSMLTKDLYFIPKQHIHLDTEIGSTV